MNRVAIIGNGAGGKTTLARAISKAKGIPVCHVDSLQFTTGGGRTPRAELDAQLREVEAHPRWVIEGLGGRASIERRLRVADTVILLDFSLAQHYRLAAYRQLQSRNIRRSELPSDFKEFTLSYTWELALGIWRAHRFYKQWFLEVIGSLPATTKVYHLRSPSDRTALYQSLELTPAL